MGKIVRNRKIIVTLCFIGAILLFPFGLFLIFAATALSFPFIATLNPSALDIFGISIVLSVIIKVVCIALGIFCLCFGLSYFSEAHEDYISVFREHLKFKPLSKENLEAVEEVKNLLRKFDGYAKFKDFSVYDVTSFGTFNAWCYYDVFTQELSLFIPFKKCSRYGRERLVYMLLHEALHAQNFRNGFALFADSFNEGITELLSYYIMKLHCDEKYNFEFEDLVYYDEARMAYYICVGTGLGYLPILVNYLNANIDFFKKFVPEEHIFEYDLNELLQEKLDKQNARFLRKVQE